MQTCLLSIDLNTTRVNNQNYQHLLNSIECDRLEIHIYNYIEQKHNKLSFVNGEIIHQYVGSRKKVALDIPQALDMIRLCTLNNYDLVYILCGEYESEFLYGKLSQIGVNYKKINPSSLRQIDENNTQTTDFNYPKVNFEPIQELNQVKMQEFYSDKEENICEACYISTINSVDNTENIRFDISKTNATNSQLDINYTQSKNTNNNFDNICSLTNTKANNNYPEKNNIINISNIVGNNKNSSTKLTPEQIKKIYTYIKLKQIKQKIKSV